jgi:multidrug resistance efflux pump
LVALGFPNAEIAQDLSLSEATVKSAELRVKQAQITQDRVRMLVDKGAASRNELDDASREIEGAV